MSDFLLTLNWLVTALLREIKMLTFLCGKRFFLLPCRRIQVSCLRRDVWPPESWTRPCVSTHLTASILSASHWRQTWQFLLWPKLELRNTDQPKSNDSHPKNVSHDGFDSLASATLVCPPFGPEYPSGCGYEPHLCLICVWNRTRTF